MGKAMLIIDMPERCSECPLKSQLYDIQYICCGNHRRMTIPGNKPKPDWCPLKEIPERKDMEPGKTVIRAAQHEGYNDCLDEILKERN